MLHGSVPGHVDVSGTVGLLIPPRQCQLTETWKAFASRRCGLRAWHKPFWKDSDQTPDLLDLRSTKMEVLSSLDGSVMTEGMEQLQKSCIVNTQARQEWVLAHGTGETRGSGSDEAPKSEAIRRQGPRWPSCLADCRDQA